MNVPLNMRACGLELRLLLPLFLLVNMIPTLAAPADPMRICLRVGCAHSASAAVGSFRETALQKRSPSVIYLSGNWVLHYHAFTSFAPSWNVALSLSYFWAQMAIQLSSLDEERFQRNTFAMHMPLGSDGNNMGLGLQLEVFNMYGPVQRELMLAIASTMMGYTMRGFTGVFNARLSRGPGTAIWVTLRVTGLAALRDALAEP